MKNNLLKRMFFVVIMLTGSVIFAQIVTGTVSDASGPLPGASVVVKGTTNGSNSDFDGKFSLDNVASDAVLVVSYIGYTTQEVNVAGQTAISVTLEEDSESLEEVVVTALGIKKETRALGYSLTQVSSEELSVIPTTGAVESLQGKVAGLNITQNSTGAAGSTRVIIRGASSLTGNNQPLYVVNGVPISNQTNGSAGMWGGKDGGDGISGINANNIESMSVLKGGAASALYGSRASNGVILITTKSGKGEQGFGVEINSSFTMNKVNTDLQDYQTEYGQGSFGAKPGSQAEAIATNFSAWGAKLDGSSTMQWDGVSRPYSYVGSNAENFYSTGITANNTIAFSNANEKMNYRFAYSNLYNEDIVPNSGMNRNTFTFSGGSTMSEKLTSNVSATYYREDVSNRSTVSDSPYNPNYPAGLLPPNVDVRFMNPGANEDGTERRISTSVWETNPYWAAYNVNGGDKRDRLIGAASLRYDILDWLYASVRVGIDYSNISRERVTPWGMAPYPEGRMNQQNIASTQFDGDFIVGADRDITDKLAASAFVGSSVNKKESEILSLNGDKFIVPGLEDISNTRSQGYGRGYSEIGLNSIYGSAEISWNDWLYVTWTGRNDWFSTLSFPGKEEPNNEFYQSISSSAILSEVFDMGDAINFMKLRAGYSEVAGGADAAYQLALTYEIYGQGFLGQPTGRVNGGQIPNTVLIPSGKTEWEVGLDTRLFSNRLHIDLAFYGNQTENDIVGVGASPTSGYNSALQNISIIDNTGIELLISGSPIRTDNFNWETSLNYAYNKSEIVATDLIDSKIDLGNPKSLNVNIMQIVGEPFGTIFGTTYKRDGSGNIMYTYDSSIPGSAPRAISGSSEILGVGVPPTIWGWSNTFTYKNWNMYFLIDGKNGGQIFSGTNTLTTRRGLHKDTLEGRENGLSVSGVDQDGNSFTTTVAPENLASYYEGEYRIAERFVEDADYIKFRQLSVGYTFDSRFLDKSFLESLSISFIASNLFYISKSIDNVDAEAAYNNLNAQGLEWFGVPSTRGYGLNLNIKF